MSSSSQLTFQILDILTRDETIVREDEESREVAYESGGDSDDSYSAVRRRTALSQAAAGRKEMIIHLFGKTAAGQTVRADIKGVRPFFYIRLPSKQTRTLALQAIRTYLTGNRVDESAY